MKTLLSALTVLIFSAFTFAEAQTPDASTTQGIQDRLQLRQVLTKKGLNPSDKNLLDQFLKKMNENGLGGEGWESSGGIIPPQQAPQMPGGLEGGWESSGGGTGVACFADASDAKAFDDLQAEMTRNPQPSLAQHDQWVTQSNQVIDSIKALSVLDLWENQDKLSFKIASKRPTDQILDLVSAQMNMASPIFGYRLQEASRHLSVRSWENRDLLPPTQDAHPKKPLASLCRQIQLAVRYANSETWELPEVKIEFQARLFRKLDALNQAALILHEQIYMIGHEIGHNTSDDLRSLVAFILSDAFLSKDFTPSGSSLGFRTEHLGRAFGDYFLFFAKDSIPKNGNALFSQNSRYWSFLNMLKDMREKIKQCHEENGLSMLRRPGAPPTESEAQIIRMCLDGVMDPTFLEPSFSDEQAFLFYTRWFLDMNGSDAIWNSEIFVVPSQDPDFLAVVRSEATEACQNIVASGSDHPVILKALNYCKTWKR